MNIYIDESGTFSVDEKGQQHSISCVAALIIPEIIESEVFLSFKKWKANIILKYNFADNEVKGSRLAEEDFESFLQTLALFDVLLEFQAIDLGKTPKSTIENYKKKMAENFSSSQTGQRIDTRFDRQVIASLSNNLFLQSLARFKLINKVLRIAISYYVQRFPEELGSFSWILDAKNIGITTYEKIFTHIVKPSLQVTNSSNPSPYLVGENYSALNKYLIASAPTALGIRIRIFIF